MALVLRYPQIVFIVTYSEDVACQCNPTCRNAVPFTGPRPHTVSNFASLAQPCALLMLGMYL